MPRRNESGPGRRGSARSGSGSFSGKGKSSGKSFKKSDKDNTDGRSFGRKRNFSRGESSRPDEDKSGKKFFSRSESAPSRRGPSSSGAGRQSGDFKRRENKRFGGRKEDSEFSAGSKSRFSTGKRPERSSGKRPEGGRKERPERPGGGRSESPRAGKSERFRSGKSENFRAAGSESRKGRSPSFGKPYKKTYKTRPVRESSERRRRTDAEASTAPKSDKIRLNKFIANSGVSSRREADELITMGLIAVNGKIITELGYKVDPGDEVRYEDKVLHAEKPVYVLMNKPKGYLTTTDDPQERKTVMQIIGSAVKERIYPVGRLDRNSTGLLLLTNDGDLADKLMHPSFNIRKVYKVELDKPLAKGDFQAIVDGVRLDEGRAVVDDVAIVTDDRKTVGVELHIGWNRVVRRIFESLGYEVLKLDRTVYAGLDKKDLGRGEWRFLKKEEIIHLKHFK